jgi:hypothetical protein
MHLPGLQEVGCPRFAHLTDAVADGGQWGTRALSPACQHQRHEGSTSTADAVAPSDAVAPPSTAISSDQSTQKCEDERHVGAQSEMHDLPTHSSAQASRDLDHKNSAAPSSGDIILTEPEFTSSGIPTRNREQLEATEGQATAPSKLHSGQPSERPTVAEDDSSRAHQQQAHHADKTRTSEASKLRRHPKRNKLAADVQYSEGAVSPEQQRPSKPLHVAHSQIPVHRQPPDVVSSGTEKLQGLHAYAKQTLQQYANGATLHTMRARQTAAKSVISGVSDGLAVGGTAHMSPNMLYMQNLTAIVLLTIENLQQRGLIAPRLQLITRLRRHLGMADAPSPRDRGYAKLNLSDCPSHTLFCVS